MVLLDILTVDPQWYNWSASKLSLIAESHELIINDIIYTEISIGFERIEDLEQAFSGDFFKIIPMPKEVLFLAGKAFLRYKSNNGNKLSITRLVYRCPRFCAWDFSGDKGYKPL